MDKWVVLEGLLEFRGMFLAYYRSNTSVPAHFDSQGGEGAPFCPAAHGGGVGSKACSKASYR